MKCYAILCGAAPEDFRQKRLIATHEFLTSADGRFLPESNIVIFPNGVNELILESVLNNLLDIDAEEIALYFYLLNKSDDKHDVILLGSNEIRKEIIDYYSALAKKLEIKFFVKYDSCCDFISEEELGYEKVPEGEVEC